MADISPEVMKEFLSQVAEMIRQHSPPVNCGTKPPVGIHPQNALVYFSPGMQELVANLGTDQIERLEILIRIHPKVLEGLAGMSEKEWEKFAKSMDFLATSSTAVKVIAIAIGACASTLLGLFALAKSGIDLFSAFRDLPKP